MNLYEGPEASTEREYIIFSILRRLCTLIVSYLETGNPKGFHVGEQNHWEMIRK